MVRRKSLQLTRLSTYVKRPKNRFFGKKKKNLVNLRNNKRYEVTARPKTGGGDLFQEKNGVGVSTGGKGL